MNARSLTWRLLVPLSLAIFVLVALGQMRPELEIYPGIERAEAASPTPAREALARCWSAAAGVDWIEISADGDTDPSSIATLESGGLLWIAADGLATPSRRQRGELEAVLNRFGADLVLVENAQGSYLPWFSRPEASFGVQGFLRRWAEQADLPVARWRVEPATEYSEADLARALLGLDPSLAAGRRVVLAGPTALRSRFGRNG